MIRPAALVTLVALALSGCGREREGAAPPEAAEAEAARDPAPPGAPGGEAEPEPLDPAAVARALDEDDALDAENRATYERRRRSMSSYQECMRQARDLPAGETRARIEEACERRKGGR